MNEKLVEIYSVIHFFSGIILQFEIRLNESLIFVLLVDAKRNEASDIWWRKYEGWKETKESDWIEKIIVKVLVYSFIIQYSILYICIIKPNLINGKIDIEHIKYNA